MVVVKNRALNTQESRQQTKSTFWKLYAHNMMFKRVGAVKSYEKPWQHQIQEIGALKLLRMLEKYASTLSNLQEVRKTS